MWKLVTLLGKAAFFTLCGVGVAIVTGTVIEAEDTWHVRGWD